MKKILNLLFLFTAISFLSSACYAQGGPPPEKAPPPKDGKHLGLQIDKINLLKGLLVGDSTLNFKEDNKDKMPIFVAHGVNNSIVEVTGTENNLRNVTYKFSVIPDNNTSIKSVFDKIGNLIGVVIPRRELITWMVKYYKSLNAEPSKEIGGSYSMAANLIIFNYDPPSKSITFSIATEY